MVDIILTGLLLAVWLPGVAWAFAWWDVKKRATAKREGEEALLDRIKAEAKIADSRNDDHCANLRSMEKRIENLERNLREAGLNPKTPLSKQAGMMPFGKRG